MFHPRDMGGEITLIYVSGMISLTLLDSVSVVNLIEKFVAEELRKPDRRRIWWQEEAPTGKERPRETDSGAQF